MRQIGCHSGVTPVDLPGHPLDAHAEGPVAGEPRPARDPGLTEDEAPSVFREHLEEPLHGVKPLGDPLGVVDPVEPEADQLVVEAVAGSEALHLPPDRRPFGLAADPLEVHADGEGADPGGVAPVDHGRGLAIHPGLQLPGDRVQEVVAVGADVEAQDVGAQEPFQELPPPGGEAEDLRGGPRDVPEVADPGLVAGLLEEAGEEAEVVVLGPDAGLAVDFLQDRLGEVAVDLDVVPPVRLPEGGADVGDVAERPEGLVGQAVVVPRRLLLGQPDPLQGVARGLRRNRDLPLGVHHLPIGGAAAVGDPQPPRGAQDRVEGGDQPAGRAEAADLPVLEGMDIGLAIGDHDETSLPQPLPEEVGQVRLAPDLDHDGTSCRTARRTTARRSESLNGFSM